MLDPAKFRFKKVNQSVWDDPKKGETLTVGKDKYDDKAWWEMKRKKGLSMFGDYDKDGKVNILDKYPRNKRKQ